MRITTSPSYLRDIVRSFDTQCSLVLFEFYADKLYFEMEAEVHQATEIHANSVRRDELQIQQSTPKGIRVCYRIAAMRKMLQMLQLADRVVLWVDSAGVMQIQMMIKTIDVPDVFTDFLVSKYQVHFCEQLACLFFSLQFYRVSREEDDRILIDDTRTTSSSHQSEPQ